MCLYIIYLNNIVDVLEHYVFFYNIIKMVKLYLPYGRFKMIIHIKLFCKLFYVIKINWLTFSNHKLCIS